MIIPQPGRSIRIYLPPEEPHLPPIPTVLQRPGIHDELPLMDFSIRLLFSYIGAECAIQLFTCVLLENQVLLRSSGKTVKFYFIFFTSKLHHLSIASFLNSNSFSLYI